VIHGLVRDGHGRKMSKSLGNVIDPNQMIDLHGADALRFSLARLATGGQQDIPLSVDSIQGGRSFANKIWNAARLVLEAFSGGEPQLPPDERLTAPQRWLLARHQRCVAEVNASLDRYEFAAAAQAMYRFFWSEYCDWGLEMEKERLRSKEAAADDAANVLAWILERTLRLLHPVMPFVTEEIWQRFGIGETIVRAPWPDGEEFADHAARGADAEAAWPFVEELVTTVRRFRSEHGIPSKTRIELRIVERETGVARFAGFENEVLRLAGASDIALVGAGDAMGSARLLVQGETVLVPVGDLIDLDAERERLQKRLAETDEERMRAETKLANQGFRDKAPEDVVLAEKLKVERFEREAESLREQAPARAHARAEPRQDPRGRGAAGRPAAHLSHAPCHGNEREDHDRGGGGGDRLCSRGHDGALHVAAPAHGSRASLGLRGGDLGGGVRGGVGASGTVPPGR
jgi:valyl-tRNA synthetase